AELSDAVTRFAEALAALGVEAGDRVALFLPMSPEVAIASHACAHLGAVQVPIFSGFAAPAVAARLRHSEAKVVVTADGSLRRGREVPMKELVDAALEESPWEEVGGMALGCTIVFAEGAPDWPAADRVWGLVESERVSVLGLSPTLVRALIPHGAELVERHDLGSLRVMVTTGEPWNPEPYR